MPVIVFFYSECGVTANMSALGADDSGFESLHSDIMKRPLKGSFHMRKPYFERLLSKPYFPDPEKVRERAAIPSMIGPSANMKPSEPATLVTATIMTMVSRSPAS